MNTFSYRGSKTTEISFPLGGIGTGCIGLSGNGRLIDWEIFGRPNKGSINGFTHFAIKAEAEGEVLDARILQGDLHPPYSGALRAKGFRGFGWGPAREYMVGAPHYPSVEFRGAYPMAELAFSGAGFPGKPMLQAFNPFIPLNADDSGIPAAFFEIELQNTSSRRLDYTVLCALSNPQPANNINRFAQEGATKFLHLSSDGNNPDDPGFGDLTLATDGTDCSYQEYWFQGAWFDNLEVYWRDFTNPGKFSNRRYPAKEAGAGSTGLIAIHQSAEVGETIRVRFVISWRFPNCEKYWESKARHRIQSPCCDDSRYRWHPYYATLWPDSKTSAHYALTHWDRLEGETREFQQSLLRSTLPEAALEGISANLALLKSPTVLRLEDGTLYGWEGCGDDAGCCEGSCTHVWNYAQAIPFLFPALERSMREANYQHNQDDDGGMHFRIQLPLGSGHTAFRPCADGQFGDVIKTYRDWKICGDSDWLHRLWPAVRKSIEYAWSSQNPDQWDPEKTGVLWGRQHHTLDMELFGPNSWLTGHYLAALKAGAEMARHLGENDFADELEDLFAKGKSWTDEHLFNGEYYHQIIDLKDGAPAEHFDTPNYWNAEHEELKYQVGEGCGIDQIIAQWHANLYGLDDIFDPKQVRQALGALYRHNFCPDLREHFNACRIYSINNESGLVICQWPEGTYRPMTPLPYAGETMNGFEWAAAIQMIQNGMISEGMTCVQAIRDRYDGEKRNPWNEFECGNNYARSMASYSLLNAFSGFSFDRVKGYVGFRPIETDLSTFRCFWSLEGAWGEIELGATSAELRVLSGSLDLAEIALPLVPQVVSLGDQKIDFRIENGRILLERNVRLEKDRSLRIEA